MKGKYESTAKKSSKKGIALLLVLFLLVGCVVGATFAWLTDTETPITDTFTVGSVSIYLNDGVAGDNGSWSENAREKTHNIAPGVNVTDFDPYVKVDASSENCWLFVKVEKEGDLGVTLADCWKATDVANVYVYSEADAAKVVAAGANYQIIKNDTITVPNTLGTDSYDVNISAYAAQADGVADANAAMVILGLKAGA